MLCLTDWQHCTGFLYSMFLDATCLAPRSAPRWPCYGLPPRKIPLFFCISFSCAVHATLRLFLCCSLVLVIAVVLKDQRIFFAFIARVHMHTPIQACMHVPIHTSSVSHVELRAVFLPEVPSHIRPALIIKGRGVRVDPLSVQLRAGDPLIHSSGFVWASGLTHLPTPQASAGPWSEGRLLFSSNNCS